MAPIRVTPPVAERAEVTGLITTVPGVAFTARLPKFISTVFVIAIGVMMVAVAVAVADTWAKVAAVKATRITANEIDLFKSFISVSGLIVINSSCF